MNHPTPAQVRGSLGRSGPKRLAADLAQRIRASPRGRVVLGDLRAPTPRAIEELHALAHRVGRILGRQRFGSPECYTLIYNAARTRRCPWPHVHLVLAATVTDKRRNLTLLHLKHILRWRRWPLLRWLFRDRATGHLPASV